MDTKPTENSLITREDAAQIMAVGLRTIARFIDTGALPQVKIGRAVRIKRVDLDTFIDARTTRLDPKRARRPLHKAKG